MIGDRAPVGIDIRPISAEELPRYFETMAVPFSFDATDAVVEAFAKVEMVDRIRAAFDGTAMVGTSQMWDYPVTVPGGTRLATAALTGVTVLPTHRRRGILTAMMRSLLDDALERGEPLSALWSSEATIYRRYGYGPAVPMIDWTVDPRRVSLRKPVEPPGAIRLVDVDEARKLFPPVHEAVAEDRHGMFGRSSHMWDTYSLLDLEAFRRGATARRHVVYEEGGEILGYAHYRTKEETNTINVTVGEAHSTSRAGYVALWDFVLSMDLVHEVKAYGRPRNEPLCWMLDDTRAIKAEAVEGVWFRLIDVPGALGTRRYRTSDRIVLRIDDPFCPWNSGTYELEGGPDGAACRRVDREPDVAMDASTLGSIYMGGHDPRPFAYAGHIAGTTEALNRLDAMFRTSIPPWSPEYF